MLRPLILSSTQRSPTAPQRGTCPRSDFHALADCVGGRISHPDGGSAPVRALEERLRLDVSQAIRARRTNASVYVSFSERVGIPLSMLGPKSPHILIAHVLTSAQKRRVAQLTGFLERTDVTLVFSRALERYLKQEIGLPAERAQFISDKVDHQFFLPAGELTSGAYVLSVGREQRDYETLIEAVRPLRIPCVIVPGSTWSRRTLPALSLPGHVELRHGLTYPELRALYHGARVVVVPVRPATDYAAGVNGVLEAMACARPVIVSDTPGLSGYVTDGVDGRHVRPGDAVALRSAIEELWEDGARAEQLAVAGRRTVERERTIEHFVARVSDTIDAVA
jgi:glycosyltransferase involved in cell wall biosynthesis